SGPPPRIGMRKADRYVELAATVLIEEHFRRHSANRFDRSFKRCSWQCIKFDLNRLTGADEAALKFSDLRRQFHLARIDNFTHHTAGFNLMTLLIFRKHHAAEEEFLVAIVL